jgi:hypothetical protein
MTCTMFHGVMVMGSLPGVCDWEFEFRHLITKRGLPQYS